MGGQGDHRHLDEHDLGLAHDLSTLLDRRRGLKVLAGAALLSLAACGGDDDGALSPASSSSTAPSATPGGGATSSTQGGAGATCQAIPSETAGPFPGNGSNGPNVLDDSGIVRRDITSSLGSSTTRAQGVPLTVKLVIQDQGKRVQADGRRGRVPVALQPGGPVLPLLPRGHRRELPAGRAGGRRRRPGDLHQHLPGLLCRALAPHPLRGVPEPGQGHVAGQPDVSQLALPEDACKAAYATTGYETSLGNLAGVSLARDGVFRDGYARQLATVSGSAGAGYSAELSVPV